MFFTVKSTLAALAISLVSFAGTQSMAASYAFDVIWDGTSFTETSAGSGLTSTVLNDGDDFTLTVRAAGTGYWTALNGDSNFPLNPRASGQTFGNVDTDILNDGVVVATDSNVNEGRCCAELGTTNWGSLADGTMFDMVVMDYTLLSGGSQTIFASGMSTASFWPTGIFSNSGSFSYTPGSTSDVPLPAGGVLMISGLVGFAALRRRKARA